MSKAEIVQHDESGTSERRSQGIPMRVRRGCGPTASPLTSKTGKRLTRRDLRISAPTQATTPLPQTLSLELIKKPKGSALRAKTERPVKTNK